MASREAPVTIGLLFSQTGVTSFVERTQRQAALLAVDEINEAGGILGRELVVVNSDPASSTLQFRSEAERLLKEGVAAIFGCYMSSSRKIVLPVIEQRQSLLFYPTFYEGFEYSSSCIYSGAVTNQNARWLADYLVETYGDRYFLVGSDYVFPRESNRIMRDLLTNRQAEVVDEVYVPLHLDHDTIERVIKRIRKAGPVVVFANVVGEGALRFYEAYDRAGFNREKQPIASLTFGEPEIASIGGDAAVGHIKASPYFSVIDSSENFRFVTAYRNRFGAQAPISADTEAAYIQVRLFAEAARSAGEISRQGILRTLPTLIYHAPQGPIRIDAATHHTYLWPRVAVVGEGGAFNIVRTSPVWVRPDPYRVEHDAPDDFERAVKVFSGAG